MSPEELNTALLVEFKRLGGDRSKIDLALADFGVTGVQQLAAAQYQPLITAVRALS
jgi:hypothetical protein